MIDNIQVKIPKAIGTGLGSTPAIKSINWSTEAGSEYSSDKKILMKYATSVTIFGWSFVVLHVVSVRRTIRHGNILSHKEILNIFKY